MAWDFSTEPEFEEKLEWMRGFVREEVFPLETLDLTYDQVRVAIRPLQDQVKTQGLWAAHLPSVSCTRSWASRRSPLWSWATTHPTRAMRSCWRWGSRRPAMKSNVAGSCSRCSTATCAAPFR